MHFNWLLSIGCTLVILRSPAEYPSHSFASDVLRAAMPQWHNLIIRANDIEWVEPYRRSRVLCAVCAVFASALLSKVHNVLARRDRSEMRAQPCVGNLKVASVLWVQRNAHKNERARMERLKGERRHDAQESSAVFIRQFISGVAVLLAVHSWFILKQIRQ